MKNTSLLPSIGNDIREILGVFEDEVFDAHFHVGQRYVRLLNDYNSHDSREDGSHSVQRQELIQALSRLPYTLWGLISASTKRAKREVVFNELLKEKAKGVDIPPSVVHHVARVVLGHGFDEKIVMKRFAEKGRTAADKTETTLEDLVDTVERLILILRTVEAHIQHIRAKENTRWVSSAEYGVIAGEVSIISEQKIKGVPFISKSS